MNANPNAEPLEVMEVVQTACHLTSAGICPYPWAAVYVKVVGTEAELVQAGALLPAEIPGPRRGASRRTGEIIAGRCSDGRINVTAYAGRAAKLNLGFQDFLRGLLADTQLSIVRHEKPDTYR